MERKTIEQNDLDLDCPEGPFSYEVLCFWTAKREVKED